jgi:hypothetical protein
MNFVVSNKEIKFSNQLIPNYRGIWTEKSAKNNFISNNISVVGAGDWRPNAIQISDGQFNMVIQNTLHAGNGLQVTGDGMFSNYYCNTFDNCVNGIQLGWNVLRNSVPGPGANHDDTKIHAHSYRNTAISLLYNFYGRPNVYQNSIKWGSDIHVYNQAIGRNQWDFSSGVVPRISYHFPSPQFPNGIVHNPRRYEMCESGSSPLDTTQGQFNDSQFVDYESETNPVLKWKLMFGIASAFLSSETNEQINNPAISDLVEIEHSIAGRNYIQAANQLSNYNPTNSIESSYKTVYEIWVNNRLGIYSNSFGNNTTRIDTLLIDSNSVYIDTVVVDTAYHCLFTPELNDSLVSILSAIASQNATLENPAAYPARAILWGTKHLLFEDSPLEPLINITGTIDASCSGYQNCTISIITNTGSPTGISTTTDSSGNFFFDGGLLQTLDSSMLYQCFVLLPDSTVLTSNAASWRDLAFSSSIDLSCVSLVPFNQTTSTQTSTITIYPNPGDGHFQLANLPEKWYIAVYSVTGQQVYEKEGEGSNYSSLTPLPSGLYTIKIKSKDNGQESIIKYISM